MFFFNSFVLLSSEQLLLLFHKKMKFFPVLAAAALHVVLISMGTNGIHVLGDRMCSYIVTPNGTCTNTSHVPCQTFDSYIQDQTKYFISNTSFCFMSGNHVLDSGNIVIENVSNITFVGLGTLNQRSIADKVNDFNFTLHFDEDQSVTFLESATLIMCKNSSGLMFSNVYNLSIISLTIVNCGANMTETLSVYNECGYGLPLLYVAVLLINVTNLLFDASSIQNSTGYGLIGINILGQSQITGSSFVGNNQFVKNTFMLYSPTVPCVDGSYYNSSSVYAWNSTGSFMDDRYFTGGNALFMYIDVLHDLNMDPFLNISHCLFSLGADSSFGYDIIRNLYVLFNSQGTGLSLFVCQIPYYVTINIESTVAYRNQATFGAHFLFAVYPGVCKIMLFNVTSTRAVSWSGSLKYIINNPIPNITVSQKQNQLIIVNSTFSTDFHSNDGIHIDLYSQPAYIVNGVLIHIEQCNFLCNIKMFSYDSSTLTPQVYIQDSVFSTLHCNDGIGAYFVALSVSNCTFNHASLYGYQSTLSVSNSTFSNSKEGGILVYNSDLLLTGDVGFINNTIYDNGAGISLIQSYLTLNAPANVTFINNTATFNGGAIYIDYIIGNYGTCNIFTNGTQLHLHFDGNLAHGSGNVLYGGDIDKCYFNCNYSKCTFVTNGGLLNFLISNATYTNGNSLTMISSDARMVCDCTNGTMNCNDASNQVLNVYPGQTINMSIITVGQLNGPSPDFVLNYQCNVGVTQSDVYDCTIPSIFQQLQQTQQHCSNYYYQVETIRDPPYMSIINLIPRSVRVNSNMLYSTYSKFMRIQTCPHGFIWNTSTRICDCSQVLQMNNVQCDINTLTVLRSETMWIGNSSGGILAVHPHCPYDYCLTSDKSKSLSLTSQNNQCDNNRSGVLCGGCQEGLSAVFGSNLCKRCTSLYLLILVPISIMGIVLVFVLLVLNCTVSVGTINGFILYANILKTGIISLLSTSNKDLYPLFVLIEWANLNLGIETCFYNGMQAYGSTWLQFIFPLYILILVGVIAIGSRWSSTLAWLCKRNAVPVLATLILLSYTKFLNTVLTIFTSTKLYVDTVTNPTADNPPIWLADGNVVFFQDEHIFLLAAGAVVSIAFIIPYMSLLLLLPWLQVHSHRTGFGWMIKLKPFIDAYQAPFKDRYRYWPGVQLMVRVSLYLVFATNLANDININLLAIVLVTFLYVTMTNILSVYKSVFVNMLETIFMLNLNFLSASMLFVNRFTQSVNNLLIASAIGGLVTFLTIVIFHSYRAIDDLVQWHKKKQLIIHNSYTTIGPEQTEYTPLFYDDASFREPLLDDNDN